MPTITRRQAALANALLWCSTDGDGEPLDKHYGVGDIDAAGLAQLGADFDAFCEAAEAALWEAIGAGTLPDWFDPERNCLADLGPSHEAALEHDYILTRNHHGAGFWDGDWQTLGNTLTTLAQSLPGLEPYVGDDRTVYLYGF